jgi:hypothetical protein
MMVEDRAITNLLDVENPLAWTFPGGLVMLAATLIGLAVFVCFPRTLPPSCEMQLRTVLTFAIPAGVGGALTPLAIARFPPALRLVAAVMIGLAATALAWVSVANLFPSYC